MKNIVFLTPPDAEYGFILAGAVQHIPREECVEEYLKKILTSPGAGLVVIDERLLSGISDEKLREMEDRWYGVMLILPAPQEKGFAAEDYAMRLISRAIGYHVRLR